MAHREGQQHPIKIYLVVWGWLFVLSTCSFLVDYLGCEGYLRWFLILLFMIRPRPLGSKSQGLSTRAGVVTSPGGLPFSDFNRNHGQLGREEAARLRSRAANLS